MGDWIDHLVYFVGSGLAFFVGCAFILAGVILSPGATGRLKSLFRNLASSIGIILLAISAAPLEWWLYALLIVLTVAWLAAEWQKNLLPARAVVWARLAVAAGWILALIMEIPYHWTPSLPTLGKPEFCLIGDSVSAGMSDADKKTWPKLLEQQRGVAVCDCSQMGATVKSARKQAAKLGDRPGLVLLEIGGNDILGSKTAAEFGEQLDLLLADVCRPNRTVVMLALPLPPLMNAFGLSQRRLARKYHVILIPQHVFAGLLTSPGATVDGIHLTPQGHQRMADTVWGLIEPAYE
jgi:acyl-CoA thioesterase-1